MFQKSPSISRASWRGAAEYKVRLRIPCRSPQKTCLLSGQRRRMLTSQSTDLRIMGFDITTTIYFPARIERVWGCFPMFLLVLEPFEASASPWDRYHTVMYMACWRSGVDITRLQSLRGRIRYRVLDIYHGRWEVLLCQQRVVYQSVLGSTAPWESYHELIE